LIDLINLSEQFTGDYLFYNVSLRINSDDKIALVGSNGAGKSTLLNIISGKREPDNGTVRIPKKYRIGYLPQELVNMRGSELFTEVKESLEEVNKLQRRDEELQGALQNVADEKTRDEILLELGEVHHKLIDEGFYKTDAEIKKVLAGLGFSESDFQKPTEEFSGGWQMRIELAKILLANNNCILLDEPTNHLDIDSLQWLIQFLQNFKGELLIVSHDRYFINKVTNKTLEIYNNKVNFYKGSFDDYLQFKEERKKRLIEEKKQQQREIAQTEKFIERFRYKNTKAKQVQSRVKQLEKMERIEIPDEENKITLRFPNPPRSGSVPIELKNVSKSYGENRVINNFSFQFERNDKVAFLGPNGAGKSTLAKLIAGIIDANGGEVKIGHNVQISYYAQEVTDNLNFEETILEAVGAAAPEHTEGNLRSLLGSFLFTGDSVNKKIKVLSGGEKSRVALCKIMLTKANVIVLDEPTNHLDFDSKKILQSALVHFEGTLVIVSHDVEFLRPVANKILEIRPNKITAFLGDVDYYLYKRNEAEKNLAEEAKNKKSENISSKKEMKRLEAEKRQKRFTETKEIKAEVERLETEIESLEKKKENLENELAKEKNFSDPAKAKELNRQYEVVKEKLNATVDLWSELSERLEEIEKRYR